MQASSMPLEWPQFDHSSLLDRIMLSRRDPGTKSSHPASPASPIRTSREAHSRPATFHSLLTLCLAFATLYFYRASDVAHTALVVEQSRSHAREQRLQEQLSTLEANAERCAKLVEKAAAVVQTKHVAAPECPPCPPCKECSAAPTGPQQAQEELTKLRKVNSLWTAKFDRAVAGLQRTSRDLVLLKFGEGPYRVRFTLRFPQSVGGDTGSFVLEMAPLDLMPHTVWWFLRAVDSKFWESACFIRNAPHVLQANPQTTGRQPLQKHQDVRSDNPYWSVSFQEYSPAFQHELYTVGVAGRPGGPDWYINIIDNVRNHGPGGQGQYDLPSEADPCFGKIIEGRDVVDRMKKIAVEPGSFNMMREFVEIVETTIIK